MALGLSVTSIRGRRQVMHSASRTAATPSEVLYSSYNVASGVPSELLVDPVASRLESR
jgi:hypothetical protein